MTGAPGALTQAKLWPSTVFGTHTQWGGQDRVPVVAPAESELDRALSEQADLRALTEGRVA